MESDRLHTACFSGHRSFKAGDDDPAALRERLRRAIGQLYAEGYRTFLSGMAEGFDLLAARAVLDMRLGGECPGARLVAVVPYAGHGPQPDGKTAGEYAAILRQADRVEVLAQAYHPRCFHVRNDHLIRHSSRLVCYYNGTPGGTRYTYEKALRSGLRPINLCLLERMAVTGTLF